MSSDETAHLACKSYELRNSDAACLLLLLHGIGRDRNQPLGILRGRILERYAVLAPDARAHGENDLVGTASDFSFGRMAADVTGLIRTLGQLEKPVYVLGFDMGAAVALRLVLMNTLDVRGVCLVSPAHCEAPVPSNLRVFQELARGLQGSNVSDELRRFVASPRYRELTSSTPIQAKWLVDQFHAPDAATRSIRFWEIPRNIAYSTPPSLSRVDPPALVVSTPGRMFPKDLAATWARNLKRGHLVRESDDRATLRRTVVTDVLEPLEP